MRTTVVFILRLLVDEGEPGVLRGTLRDVSSGEEQAFSDLPALLELLISQTSRTVEITGADQTTR